MERYGILMGMKEETKMNVGNLCEGMIVKNYRELCRLLGEKEVGGKSKTYQLKDWKRYFNYEKDGNKYIILEIYEETLEKNDLRIKGIYNEYMQYLLLNFIARQKGYQTQLILKQLYPEFGFVNDKYFITSDKDLKNNLLNSCQDADFYINDYRYRVNKKMKEILFSSLKSLKNRMLIDYYTIDMIKIIEKDERDNFKMNVREANIDEINNIRDIKREVLKYYGYNNIDEIHKDKKQFIYFNKVNQLLKERYNIDQSWQEIKILFTKRYILDGLKETDQNIKKLILSDKDKDTHRKMINDKFINVIDEQAEKNYSENHQEYFGEPNRMNDDYKYGDPSYLYSQKKLNEFLGKMIDIYDKIDN